MTIEKKSRCDFMFHSIGEFYFTDYRDFFLSPENL